MRTSTVAALGATLALFTPTQSRAHCDTLDGPVVATARKALDSGQLSPVLAWVQARDEQQIRRAFEEARTARQKGGEARSRADTRFFETLVRVHRAGEGAPYTGLKPAGQELSPAVAAADIAAAKGDAAELERILVEAVRHGLHERMARLKAEQPPGADVAAGRAWVAAYVPFVHWAEAVEAAATGGGAHGEEHHEKGAEAPAHHGH